ncbi:hypothetical protein BH23THE1_BH23THE1_08470 [soil metagenome]
MDIYHYINFISIKGRKVQYVVNILTIFVLLTTLVMGSISSNWNVYAQSNETNSQTENVIQIIPESSQEQITENTNDQSTSETASSDNTSDIINDDQNIAGESNTPNVSPNSQPDGDCLFDPSLPKCTPDENGNCPEGFHMNEDEQCFPAHDMCPSGYHSHEDDESGKCIPDSVPCQPGYILSPDFPECQYKDHVCQKHPNLDECKVDDETASNLPYRSGYNHGCSDAKISDPSKRYINQPGKGPDYHTTEFMRGYNDGFDSCLVDNGSSSSPTANGIFRVIVQVTNQSPQDITGGITVSVDHQPENIFRSAYGLYFPGGGETTSTTFTFKASEVPIGTGFEVNLDYGDDYNQYTFGENSPVKRPEIVQFNIS